MIPVQLMLTRDELDLLRDLATVLRPGGPAWEAAENWDLDRPLCEALADKLAVAQEPQQDDLAGLAEQRFPDRPINLPEGQAVVVPTPERKAFIAGAAWQAAQSADARCPIGLDDAHEICSAGCCFVCIRERLMHAIACRDEALESAQLWRQNWNELYQEAERLKRQVLAVLEPFARKADAASLSGALGHIERAHLTAARDLVAMTGTAADIMEGRRVDDQWA